MMSTPAHIIGDSGYDDAFQVNQALSICLKSWLGDYIETTLSKGVSFPVFLCAAKVVCMPYYMLLALFYFFAAAVFVAALRDEVKNSWVRLGMYLFLIYNPVSFSGDVTARIYRNAICYPAVLLTTAAMIGAYLRKDKGGKSYVLWLALTGFSFTFFYYIREDSVWLVPMAGAVTVLIILWNVFRKKKSIKRIAALAVPYIIFLCISLGYMAMNHRFYGAYIINDRTGGEFAEITEKLLKVEEGRVADKTIWVSRETFRRTMEECPSVSGYADTLVDYYNIWSTTEGTRGDLYVWALRQGLYDVLDIESAAELQDASRLISDEIDRAFEEGRLHKTDLIYLSSQTRGLEKAEVSAFIGGALKNWLDVVTYKCVTFSGPQQATGSESEIRLMEAMTGAHGLKGINSEGDEDSMVNLQSRVYKVNNGLIRLYALINKLLIVMAGIGQVVLVVAYFRKRTWRSFDRAVIPLGVLLSSFVLVLGVSFMVEWIGYAGLWFYSSGTPVLVSIFEILSVYWGTKNIIDSNQLFDKKCEMSENN